MGSRWPLGLVAVAGLLVGCLPLFWLLKRFGRALTGRSQLPVGALRYLLALATAALGIGIGLGALGLGFALTSWQALTSKTHVAEVQCISLAPGKLRLYYVPISQDHTRGATETYDLDGDEWTVGGDVLRFRPFLNVLGLETIFRVSRVEGRWLKAEDAKSHVATAHDREAGDSRGWLLFYREGHRKPLGWLIAGAHGQAVSQLPDRRALFDLYVTPNGFVIDKRSL